jgi:hypothetical protein
VLLLRQGHIHPAHSSARRTSLVQPCEVRQTVGGQATTADVRFWLPGAPSGSRAVPPGSHGASSPGVLPLQNK